MPSHGTSPRSQAEPLLVGLAGRIGAGKTAAAEYLEREHGFQSTRYSKVIRRWRGSDATTLTELRELGWQIMSSGQQAELNARLIAGLDRSHSAVIDGLRHPIDFRSLSDAFGPAFHLMYLEATPERRFDHHNKGKYLSREDFAAADAHPVEAQVDGLRTLAEATILNEGPLDLLHRELNRWLTVFRTGDKA
jgi:dephospho-CoA kinase